MHKDALALWKNEDLPKIVAVLQELAPELAERPLWGFVAVINKLIKRASQKINKRCGFSSCAKMPKDTVMFFAAELVSSLNGVLPIDHPYIIVFVCGRGPSRFAVLKWKKISGINDIINDNLFPIILLNPNRLSNKKKARA